MDLIPYEDENGDWNFLISINWIYNMYSLIKDWDNDMKYKVKIEKSASTISAVGCIENYQDTVNA